MPLYCKRGDLLTTYEDMLIEADGNNLITKEKLLRAHKGRIMGNRIAINKNLPEIEKKCVMGGAEIATGTEQPG